MRVVTLASGSSGNAIYIGSDHTHILVDAGISNKKIEERLNEIGVDMRDLSGIWCYPRTFRSHSRAFRTCKKASNSIYSTEGTIQVIKAMGKDERGYRMDQCKERFRHFMLGDFMYLSLFYLLMML